MSPLRTRASLALAAAAAMALAACSGSSSSDNPRGNGSTSAGTDSITVYSGRSEALVAPLIEKFTAATGIAVEVRYGNSAEMAAQLLEEGGNTPADVFYSQEVGAVGALAKADLMGTLPESTVALADERFQPAGDRHWVGITARSRVIVYNPDLVAAPPAGVLDLTKPQYSGQTAWVPGNAGFQAFITGFRVSEGEAAAASWLKDMKANGAETFESNGDVLEAVNSGAKPMGLINHYYWAELAAELGGPTNLKAKLIFPAGDDPGGLVNATAAGVTNKGEGNASAQAFVEFLLSEQGQTYFVEETSEYPVVDGIDDPAGLPALEDLEGPDLDLTDLDSLLETQALLTSAGLLS